MIVVDDHRRTCEFISSGCCHHVVSDLVFGQCEDWVRGVSGGEVRVFEEQARTITCFRMNQIVNILSLYALENGLLTR